MLDFYFKQAVSSLFKVTVRIKRELQLCVWVFFLFPSYLVHWVILKTHACQVWFYHNLSLPDSCPMLPPSLIISSGIDCLFQVLSASLMMFHSTCTVCFKLMVNASCGYPRSLPAARHTSFSPSCEYLKAAWNDFNFFLNKNYFIV